jgi:ATP-dependent Clp protease ATP-binding subunit ClpA
MKQQLIDDYLIGVLRPEFVNRFDGIVLFKPLSLVEVTQITKLLVAKLAKLLEAQGISLELSEAGASVLAAAGYQPQFGARPLRRLLQERVENVIAKKILAGEIARRDKVLIDETADIRVLKARKL